MRAFTLRSAERQVELQDELSRKRPGAASEVNGASGVDRKFTAGIIGVTILVPIVILIIIVGIVRTRCNTRRTRGTTNAAHGVDPNNGGTFFRVTPNPNGGVPIENGAMEVNSSSDALHGQHDFTWSDPMSNGKESKHAAFVFVLQRLSYFLRRVESLKVELHIFFWRSISLEPHRQQTFFPSIFRPLVHHFVFPIPLSLIPTEDILRNFVDAYNLVDMPFLCKFD